jgi:hypothetical protein
MQTFFYGVEADIKTHLHHELSRVIELNEDGRLFHLGRKYYKNIRSGLREKF